MQRRRRKMRRKRRRRKSQLLFQHPRKENLLQLNPKKCG
jgi:hypothetical protein